jgi:hypothetical protein
MKGYRERNRRYMALICPRFSRRGCVPRRSLTQASIAFYSENDFRNAGLGLAKREKQWSIFSMASASSASTIS